MRKNKQSVDDNTGQKRQEWQGQEHLQQKSKKNNITKWAKKITNEGKKNTTNNVSAKI